MEKMKSRTEFQYLTGVESMLTIEKIKREVFPLAKKYNIAAVHLFGSLAEGNADETSDADFLVRFIVPVPSIFKVLGFREELQKKLHTSVDIVTVPIPFPEKLKIGRTISIYES
jgi:uncharacterized protein